MMYICIITDIWLIWGKKFEAYNPGHFQDFEQKNKKFQDIPEQKKDYTGVLALLTLWGFNHYISMVYMYYFHQTLWVTILGVCNKTYLKHYLSD